MDATTVDELLTREYRDDRPALVDATGRSFDRHWLCTTSWKAGNFLRHAGVRRGVTVGVAGDDPFAVLACFGTTLLEARTRFDPPTDATEVADLQALVAPVDALEAYDVPRGTTRYGYGGDADDPTVRRFDSGLWNENPAFPPLDVDPETELLADGERTVTHETALAAARDVIDAHGLGEGDRVVVRGPLSDPRVVVAGVIAPLLAEGVVVLAEDSAGSESDRDESASGEPRGSVAVSSDPVPESGRIDPSDVRL